MISDANPFEYGRPIADPNNFIGRSNELIRIRDAVYKLCSISIVGERRTGKSSLLRQFISHEFLTECGFDMETYLFCFVDLQGLEDIEPPQFWELLLLELANNLSSDAFHVEKIKNVVNDRNFDNLSLRGLFKQLSERKIIFLFDEFETVLSNLKFPKSFYGHLRYLSQNCSVAFVTATQRELVYHCLDDDTKTSPFFNIFDNLVVEPFTDSDCKMLVQSYLGGSTFSFSESEIVIVRDSKECHTFCPILLI